MVSTPITMPKKSKETDDDEVRVSQVRQPLKRFRVLVDRQMKSSFDKEEDAAKVAAAIKKAHPIVTISVYDAEKSSSQEFE